MALPGWSDTALGIGSGGTTKGKSLGGTPIRPPSAWQGGAGESGPTSGATPGTFDINPFAPGESAANALTEGSDWLSGTRNAIFGTSNPDFNGQHGGLIGDVPILGPAARFATEVTANVGNAVIGVGKGALDTVGGALEHVNLNDDATNRELQRKFDSLNDSVAKQEALAAIERDPGATGHYMAVAVKSAERELLDSGAVDPDFTTGLFSTPGSAAEAVDNLLGLFGFFGRLGARPWAGMATPAQGGMDRLGVIMAVGDGQVQFNEDKGLLGTGILAGDPTTGLNAVEAIVYRKVKDNEWTRDQALDFLVAHNAGFSHSAIANIGGSVAVDPSNLIPLAGFGVVRAGQAGARLSKGVEVAATALARTDSQIATLRAAGRADDAAELATLVRQRADDLKALEQAETGAYKIGGDYAGYNVLARAARSETMTDVLRTVYRTYEPLQSMHVDKMLKVVRAVVDPLGAFTLGNPLRKQSLDLMTEYGTKKVIGGYGYGNHSALVHGLSDLTDGPSSPLADMFTEDMGTYSANLIRRVVARRHRDVAIAANLGDSLAKTNVDDVMGAVSSKVPTTFDEYVLREASAQRIRAWDDIAKQNLADRLVDNYGVKSREEWLAFVSKRNEDELSMLHAATYGRANKRLLAAIEEARANGSNAGTLDSKLERLILINRTTLTEEGAGGIVKQLDDLKGVENKIEFIKSQQALYPELRGFTLDLTNPGRTVERFSDDLTRRMPAFPKQVVDDELTGLPDDLRALHTDTTFTLGFAPEDAYKWGLVRSNMGGGEYTPVYDVWVDHVAPGMGMGYRTISQRIEQNILGQPILGAAKPLARGMDYVEAGIRTLNNRVSGTIIAESARSKFIAKAVQKYERNGITEGVAKDIINRLEEAVGHQDIVVRPSGLSTRSMWEAAQAAIPKDIPANQFNRRDLLALILEAYDGDMRFVGLTQKLSMRIKRVLAFEGNNASVLAESVYPTLKYRLNLIFQMQEKSEPWVLNVMRGVTPAKSIRSLNQADKATQTLLEKMAQHSLITNADHEMAEYAGRVLHGEDISSLSAASNTAMGRLTQRLGPDWAAIRDVKGMKQINMLRTFRKGMGKELRAVWEKTDPGRWDDMYQEYVRKAGRGVAGVDEDEFAVAVMADKMLGNNVFVSAVEDRLARVARQFDKVDYEAAIKPGEWMRPQTLGELQKLDLDTMASLLRFTTDRGGIIETQAGLRAAIAAGELTVENVTTALLRLGASPDYAARVKSALEFSWTGFMDQVTADFNLTRERRERLEDILANAARLREMTPVEYVSQILIPKIGVGGQEAVIGHLGKIEDILNNAGDVVATRPNLAQLMVPEAGAGAEDMLISQLADVFMAHLDPSAKRGLIAAFAPELRDRIAAAHDIDMDVVERLWTPDMQEQFTRLLTGEINPPTDLIDALDAGALRTADDWDRVDPGTPVQIMNWADEEVGAPVARLVGDGLRSADREVQQVVLRTLGRMRAEFPDMPIRHMDVTNDISKYLTEDEFLDYASKNYDPIEDVAGITLRTKDGGYAIILNDNFYGKARDGRSFTDKWADYQRTSDEFAATSAASPGSNTVLPGAPQGIGGAEETVIHEWAHVVDETVRKRLDSAIAAARKRGVKHPEKTKEVRALRAYTKALDTFADSLAARRLSKYSTANANEQASELLALVFSRDVDPAALDRATEAWATRLMAGEFRVESPKVWADPLRIKTPADAREFAMVYDNLPLAASDDLDDYLTAMEKFEDYVDSGDPSLIDDIEDLRVELQEEALRLQDEYRVVNGNIPGEDNLSNLDPKTLRGGPETLAEAVNEVREALKKTGLWKPPPGQLDPSLSVRARPILDGMRGRDNPDVLRAAQMFNRWTKEVMSSHLRGTGNADMIRLMDKIDGLPTEHAVPYNFDEHMLMSTALENMRMKWDDAHRLQYYARERTMLERSVNHPMFGIYPASYMWGKMLPEVIRFLTREPFGMRTGAPTYAMMDVMRDVALQREFDETFDENIEALGHSASMFALGYMMPAWPWEVTAAMPTWSREFAAQGLDMQARVEAGGSVATDASSQGINLPQVAQKAMDVMNPLKAFDRTFAQPAEEILGTGTDVTQSPWYLPQDAGPVPATELGDPLSDALDSLRNLFSGSQ